ncbi:hypothetical protein ABZT27_34900 [Streptomyces sp. NPDC005389]|uniref:hypothetical protein n=1 Tax=Streptomyces sp. NPDC005389 TaxID=3157040 RepID=UPI0033AA8260
MRLDTHILVADVVGVPLAELVRSPRPETVRPGRSSGRLPGDDESVHGRLPVSGGHACQDVLSDVSLVSRVDYLPGTPTILRVHRLA